MRKAIALFLLALLPTLAACHRSQGTAEQAAQGQGPGKSKGKGKDAAPQMMTIGPADSTVAALRRVESGPALSGTLSPKREATIRALVGGSVLETYASQGQRVGQGALLARVDPGALGAGVAAARLALTNARNNLAVAERQEERERTLLAAGAVAEKDLETTRQQTVAARAGVAQAQEQLVAAGNQLGNAAARAPFAGVVSEKQVSVGDIVQLGSALYTVVDPSSLELAASVPAEALQSLAIGMPVEFAVTGYPGRRFTGRITRINPSADPATRQVRVYAELPNSENNLVSGLFAEGRVAAQSRVAIAVPNAAIDRRLGRPAVLKVSNGKVERVEVALGLADEQTDEVEIKSGVVAGDRLLVGAAQQITPGTPVQLTPPGVPGSPGVPERQAELRP